MRALAAALLFSAAAAVSCTSASSSAATVTPPLSRSADPTPSLDQEPGVVVGPSARWAAPNSITFWVEDRTSLAIVHGPAEIYALDLSDVPPCPINIREGEGQHVDKPSMDIVITCADGSVWARFDRYGRSVTGAPNRPPLASRGVLAISDGTLLVSRHAPDKPLTAYWPFGSPELPSTVDEAALALYEAWTAHDPRGAEAIASDQVVDGIFRSTPARFHVTACTPRYCWFRDEADQILIALTMKNTGHGYWVKRADFGTIEPSGPPD